MCVYSVCVNTMVHNSGNYAGNAQQAMNIKEN